MNEPSCVGRVSPSGVTRRGCVAMSEMSGYASLTRPTRLQGFNRVFFQYQPPRPLHEIDAELAGVEQRILDLLREVTE